MGETPRHVHFVAVCGTGMGSLAGLVKARGVRVTGSDEGLYPPMSTQLEAWGIPVREGFRAENVSDEAPDLVVIGNACRPDNPEARAAIDEGFRTLSFPDALYELAMAGRHPVVITGTHGKTTTTTLVAYLLHATGRDPSFLIGGIALDFGTSFHEGSGEHFVVEGDEYDTAFFDKTPKFLHYHPRTLVVTSVEFDHADIYRDLEHVKEAFRKLVAGMPADGRIVAALDHDCVRDVVRDAPCPVVGYGLSAGRELDWCADAIAVGGDATVFEVLRPGASPERVELPMFGRFNVENALAALATLDVLGVPLAESAPALARFQGVKRRQEERGEAGGVLVIDDFAHHPTAVRGSVEAARARYPERRIVAVFEPRTNTSRRAIFQERYAEAFDAADQVVIAEPPGGPIYSAFDEKGVALFSAEQLAEDLRARGIPADSVAGVDAIVEHLASLCRPGDAVLVMSNGGFGNIWEKLLAALA
ncbi:MAG: UDP-N-acetylmuramate:L-alanyl-gamma-D-glutamyl-meso-diaminopimelate ligase [Myxococcota bacterium]